MEGINKMNENKKQGKRSTKERLIENIGEQIIEPLKEFYEGTKQGGPIIGGLKAFVKKSKGAVKQTFRYYQEVIYELESKNSALTNKINNNRNELGGLLIYEKEVKEKLKTNLSQKDQEFYSEDLNSIQVKKKSLNTNFKQLLNDKANTYKYINIANDAGADILEDSTILPRAEQKHIKNIYEENLNITSKDRDYNLDTDTRLQLNTRIKERNMEPPPPAPPQKLTDQEIFDDLTMEKEFSTTFPDRPIENEEATPTKTPDKKESALGAEMDSFVDNGIETSNEMALGIMPNDSIDDMSTAQKETFGQIAGAHQTQIAL